HASRMHNLRFHLGSRHRLQPPRFAVITEVATRVSTDGVQLSSVHFSLFLVRFANGAYRAMPSLTGAVRVVGNAETIPMLCGHSSGGGGHLPVSRNREPPGSYIPSNSFRIAGACSTIDADAFPRSPK